MQKAFGLLLLFICASTNTTAQIIITGRARDTLGNPIAYATITAKDIKTDTTYGYTFTNDDGAYSISVDEKTDSFCVAFNHMNYEAIEKFIKNSSQTIDFTPIIFSKMLKEIIVTNPPITERNDTLNYRVSDFTDKNDRTLIDVLKKMPGIETDERGNIKFQGKSINKFYVEGKDLMEGNYGMITKALPSGDAGTVQVLQNHQPVRMLKDKVYSPYAAINIKLKKNVSLTGRAKLGVGVSPFLRDVAITPMLFSKKYQVLASFKSNNIGESLNKNIENEIIIGAYEGMQENIKREQWLSIAQSQRPGNNENLFLFNSDYLVSLNYLTDVGKNLELRTNLDLLKSNSTLTGDEKNVTMLPDGDTITTVKKANSITQDKYLNAKVTLQSNRENGFFRNATSFKTEYARDAGTMIMQSIPFKQSLDDHFKSFQNSFSGIVPIDKQKKYSLNIISLMNYRTGTPEYFLTPAKALVFDSITTINDSSLLQKLQYKNFVTDNSISFSVTKNRFIITPKVKYRFTQNKLESSIFENEVSQVIKNNWINDIVLRSNVKQYDLNIDYKGEKLMITSSFPLNYYSIQLEDNRQPVQNTSKWAIEPNLELLYKVNLYWEAKLAAGRTVRFSDIKELTRGNIMSELNQSSHQNGIAETISHSISQGINYKNPFSNIFISTSYSCYWVFSNTMPGVNFLQNGQTFFEQLNQQNTTVMQSANFRVGKFFTKSNTNISISFGGNKMQSQFLFNNNFSNSNIYSYNTMLNLVTGAFDKFYIDISGVYYKSHRNTIFNKSKATQFTTSSNILFTPYQNHAIKLSLNYSLGKFDHIDFYYNVFDLSYQFSMPKNKVDVEIRWNNISNQKIFNQTYISTTTTNSVNYYLRPSQILASVMFNIR